MVCSSHTLLTLVSWEDFKVGDDDHLRVVSLLDHRTFIAVRKDIEGNLLGGWTLIVGDDVLVWVREMDGVRGFHKLENTYVDQEAQISKCDKQKVFS